MLKSTFLIALSFFAANTTAAFEKRLDVEIRDSVDAIHWVNSDVLLVKAMVPAKGRLPGATYREAKAARLLTWNVVTNAVDWVSESFVGRICYVDGNLLITDRVTYAEVDERGRRKERFWVISGGLTEQSRQEVTRGELSQYDFDVACRHRSTLAQIPDWLSGKLLKRLKPQHGVVELEKDNRNEFGLPYVYPIRLYPALTNRNAVDINALRGSDVTSIWPYVQFKNAYWLEQYARVVPQQKGFFRAWWLFVGGKVEVAANYDVIKAGVPQGNWSRHIPVRDGLLRVHVRWANPWTPGAMGDAGLYRFSPDGNHRRLVRAEIGPAAVSPDGCAIAYTYDDREMVEGPRQLRLAVIDVCRFAKEGG